MNSYFNIGDWAIILLYLLGIIALGMWFGKDQHNTRDYFLGSNSTAVVRTSPIAVLVAR